jgi:hypothetical protein
MKAAARALLTAILCVLLVGFGVCGAFGAVNGVLSVGSSEGRPWGLLFITSGVIGLAIAWLCWRAIAGLWRTPPAPPSNQ